MVAVDKTTLWDISASWADVYADIWSDDGASRAHPRWATWWLTDTAGTQRNSHTIDSVANLLEQVEAAEHDCSLFYQNSIIRFKTCLTSDGAFMLCFSNSAAQAGCWLCNEPTPLLPCNIIMPHARLGSRMCVIPS